MSLKLLTPSTASNLYKLTTRTSTRASFRSAAVLSQQRQFLSTTVRKMDNSQGTSRQANNPDKDDGWKTRPPYSVHDEADFKVRYEASCHCGKVKYQLKREEPLDSKLCHCTTCQTQHGKLPTNMHNLMMRKDLS